MEDAAKQISGEVGAHEKPGTAIGIGFSAHDVMRARVNGMRHAASIAAGWSTGSQAAKDIRQEAMRIESLSDAEVLNPPPNAALSGTTG